MKFLSSSTYIIAEIGNNHNGSVSKAIELIDMSAEAGVDAVKFQTFRGLDIVSPTVPASAYSGWQVKDWEFWYQFLDTIALPIDDHQEVIDHAKKRGVDFITTPVSPDIVSILENFTGITAYKLASMDLNNFGLIRAIKATEKPVIMSTGMGDFVEVEQAVRLFGEKDLSILHCVSDYPLDPINAGLSNINVLRQRFGHATIGFSDHSLGHELTVAAVTMGARLIEKHVTLDRNDPEKAEHHFALEPDELAEMVRWIRAVEVSLKPTDWVRSPNEADGRQLFRRSFHYNKTLSAGHMVTEKDLAFIRPGIGIGYSDLHSVIDKRLRADRQAYSPCLVSDVETTL
jgi:N,N'-diacetyllegionaminate synthase